MQACDASIIIKRLYAEWGNPDNQLMKPHGFQTILYAKAAVESDPQCRHRVSYADILTLGITA